MKHLGLLFMGVALLPLVFLIGLIVFSFETDSAQTPVVISVEPDLAPIEARLMEEQQQYQTQLEQLNRTLRAKQIAYQTEIQMLNTRILAAQKKLIELQTEKQNSQSKIEQLKTTQIDQVAAYQAQVQQTREQYNERLTELQIQLQEVEDKLAVAKARLQTR